MCLPWQNNNGNIMFCTTEVQLCVKEQFVKPIISVQRCYSNEDWTHIKKNQNASLLLTDKIYAM